MISRIFIFVCVIALLLLITPAAATLVLTDAVYTPDPPFMNGTRQHVIAKFFIIPSGATTFVPGHQTPDGDRACECTVEYSGPCRWKK